MESTQGERLLDGKAAPQCISSQDKSLQIQLGLEVIQHLPG